MIKQAVDLAASWFGVTDTSAIVIAQGILLAGIIFLGWYALLWVTGVIVAAMFGGRE
jgi:hypothetical protein